MHILYILGDGFGFGFGCGAWHVSELLSAFFLSFTHLLFTLLYWGWGYKWDMVEYEIRVLCNGYASLSSPPLVISIYNMEYGRVGGLFGTLAQVGDSVCRVLEGRVDGRY